MIVIRRSPARSGTVARMKATARPKDPPDRGPTGGARCSAAAWSASSGSSTRAPTCWTRAATRALTTRRSPAAPRCRSARSTSSSPASRGWSRALAERNLEHYLDRLTRRGRGRAARARRRAGGPGRRGVRRDAADACRASACWTSALVGRAGTEAEAAPPGRGAGQQRRRRRPAADPRRRPAGRRRRPPAPPLALRVALECADAVLQLAFRTDPRRRPRADRRVQAGAAPLPGALTGPAGAQVAGGRLPQLHLADLAADRHREGVQDPQAARDLVVGEPALAEGGELRQGRRVGRVARDDAGERPPRRTARRARRPPGRRRSSGGCRGTPRSRAGRRSRRPG